MEPPTSKPPEPLAPKVPEELLGRLAKINERFHNARQKLEAELNSNQYDHVPRVERAAEELRAAEKAVEEVEDQIDKSVPPPPAAGTPS